MAMKKKQKSAWAETARGRAARAAFRRQEKPPVGKVGMCLQRVREAFGIPSRYPDAKAAAEAAIASGDLVRMSPNDKRLRAGWPIFFKVGEHWHIAISAKGRGWCLSTDILRPGYTDRVRIDTINARWGATFLGPSKSVNGVKIK